MRNVGSGIYRNQVKSGYTIPHFRGRSLIKKDLQIITTTLYKSEDGQSYRTRNGSIKFPFHNSAARVRHGLCRVHQCDCIGTSLFATYLPNTVD